MSSTGFLIVLLVILVAAKLGAEAAERVKLPAVLGELLAGVVVGAPLMGTLAHYWPVLRPVVIDGNQPVLLLIAQLGAVLLLFEAGLGSDVHELYQLGPAALWVACTGVTFTLTAGFITGLLLGLPLLTSAFLGGALAATSVGITARTFADLNQSHTREAKAVLGAAIADDVIGLIVLAIAIGLTTSKSLSALEIGRIVLVAVVFLVGAMVIGQRTAPLILLWASRMKTRAALASAALALCLVLATAAALAGLSPIIGAFAAGLVLAQTEHRLHIEEHVRPIAALFIPVFFVMMGAAMPAASLNPATAGGRQALLVAGVLTIVAILSKVAAGLSTPFGRVRRFVVGAGMVPRGEVSLIFMAYGLKSGVVSGGLYSSVLLVVMATTFVTPPLLKLAFGRTPAVDDTAAAPVEAEPEPEAPAQLRLSVERVEPTALLAAASPGGGVSAV